MHFIQVHSAQFPGSANEAGIAASLNIEAARHLFVTAAADHYHIPSPRYRSSFSSYGDRIEVRGEYLPSDELSVRLSCILSSREYDVAAETGTSHVRVSRETTACLLCLNYEPATNITLTTRAGISYVTPGEGERISSLP